MHCVNRHTHGRKGQIRAHEALRFLEFVRTYGTTNSQPNRVVTTHIVRCVHGICMTGHTLLTYLKTLVWLDPWIQKGFCIPT